ncbi:MAG: response regulator [Candidatus Binatia bacterium]
MKMLIVDDHAVLREGLRQIVATSPCEAETGEAESGMEALARLREQDWNLVVLDISLPDRNGLDLLKQIKALYPKLPVLILSMHGEAEYAVRAFKSGASGYLTKRTARTELVEAIQHISRGKRYITPAVAEQLLIDSSGGETDRPLSVLSDREFQVLTMIASGLRIKAVAEQLGVSAKTVSTHRANILDKLRLQGTADLIRYAIARGLP